MYPIEKEINFLVEKNLESGRAKIEIEVDLEMLPHYLKKLKTLFNEQTFAHKNYPRYMLLTVREKEILAMIVKGTVNLKIASSLFISYDTVRTHRKNILRKLEFKNIAAFIEYSVFINI